MGFRRSRGGHLLMVKQKYLMIASPVSCSQNHDFKIGSLLSRVNSTQNVKVAPTDLYTVIRKITAYTMA